MLDGTECPWFGNIAADGAAYDVRRLQKVPDRVQLRYTWGYERLETKFGAGTWCLVQHLAIKSFRSLVRTDSQWDSPMSWLSPECSVSKDMLRCGLRYPCRHSYNVQY